LLDLDSLLTYNRQNVRIVGSCSTKNSLTRSAVSIQFRWKPEKRHLLPFKVVWR